MDTQKKIHLGLATLIIFFISLIIVIIFLSKKENTQSQKLLSDFTVCTVSVEQPDCYEKDNLSFGLRWEFKSMISQVIQKGYKVQIDDNRDFSSPEIDTLEIISPNSFYKIQNSDKLQSNTFYYWRIKVQDDLEYWSDWVNSDDSFELSPFCINEKI